MKVKLFSILLLIICLAKCDEVYIYEVNNTSWGIQVFWYGGFYQGEPTLITFYKDGHTSWGGFWEKTDELTFKWEITYSSIELGTYNATYYAQFRKNLDELIGHCANSEGYTGEFFAYKK